jgi:hypothetical protein
MPKPISALTERLLSLSIGRSCVASVRRMDPYIRSVSKRIPGSRWQVEPIDGRWVVTRIS